MSTPSASDAAPHQPQQFTVLLFAGLRDAMQREQITVSVGRDDVTPTVSQLLRECAEQFPALAKWLPHVRVAVNLEYSSLDIELQSGDEIALIPPVAGG